MLQNGHYEIDYRRGGSQLITQYVYRARELPAVINSIIAGTGVIETIREVEKGN